MDSKALVKCYGFCVIEWNWKLCILEDQNYCVKYFSMFISKGEGGKYSVLTINIYFLISSFYSVLGFDGKTEIIDNMKGLNEWALSD